jgi:hypothetical protein
MRRTMPKPNAALAYFSYVPDFTEEFGGRRARANSQVFASIKCTCWTASATIAPHEKPNRKSNFSRHDARQGTPKCAGSISRLTKARGQRSAFGPKERKRLDQSCRAALDSYGRQPTPRYVGRQADGHRNRPEAGAHTDRHLFPGTISRQKTPQACRLLTGSALVWSATCASVPHFHLKSRRRW